MYRALFALAVSALIIAVALALPRDVARAHYDWQGMYMWQGSDCVTNQRDPISLVFYSAGDLAALKVMAYLGWSNTEGGTVDYSRDHDRCIATTEQIESARYACSYPHGGTDDYCSNDHIRLWPGKDSDITMGRYEAGGVHVDTEQDCEVAPGVTIKVHLASDFNKVRNRVAAAFQSQGSQVQSSFWNNTAPSWQGVEWNLISVPCPPDIAGDGYTKLIEIPAPPIQGMSYSHASSVSDLWVCNGGNCSSNGQGALYVGNWLQNDTRRGIGAFSFRTGLDRSVVDGTVLPSTFLGSTGRGISAIQIPGPNYIDFNVSSFGDSTDTGPWSSGSLASLVLTPKSTSGMKPTRYFSPYSGAFQTTIGDQNCKVKDIFGGALPGASGDGTTPQCAGTTVNVHMLEGDLNNNCVVDVSDDQSIAFRYWQQPGDPFYSDYYKVGDQCVWDGTRCVDYIFGYPGPIHIIDLQFVFGRNYSTCSNPIPSDQRAGG